MTDIHGEGYGDEHDWERMVAPVYRCRRCNAWFTHNYIKTPDIFQAMKDAGIPDLCADPNCRMCRGNGVVYHMPGLAGYEQKPLVCNCTWHPEDEEAKNEEKQLGYDPYDRSED